MSKLPNDLGNVSSKFIDRKKGNLLELSSPNIVSCFSIIIYS